MAFQREICILFSINIIWIVCYLLIPMLDIPTRFRDLSSVGCGCDRTNHLNNHGNLSDCFQKVENSPKRHLFSVDGLDLWLHSAFLDNRLNQSWVHIFGVERKGKIKGEFLCKWSTTEGHSNDGQKEQSKANHSFISPDWPSKTVFVASAFSCRLPKGVLPKFIQLTSSDGKVKFPKMPLERGVSNHPKESVAVCVKPMTGPLKLSQLVEWFETLRAVGFNYFIIYHTDLTGKGRYALNYYQQLGLMNVISFPFLLSVLEKAANGTAKLTHNSKFTAIQHVYLTAMQDCLHRYRNAFKHILFIDYDEVLIPSKNESIQTLLARLDATLHHDPPGYMFRTAWHFQEWGSKKDDKDVQNLHIQKYVESTKPLGMQPKTVMNTNLALLVNFHSVVRSVDNRKSSNYMVSPATAGYVHHYRKCYEKFPKKSCDEHFLKKHRADPMILRLRDKVVANTRKVLASIQLH